MSTTTSHRDGTAVVTRRTTASPAAPRPPHASVADLPSLRDLLAIILARRRSALLGAVIGIGIALLLALSGKPLYESTASLAIDLGRTSPAFSTQQNDGDANQYFHILNTHREILLSSGVLSMAISASNLGANPAYAEAADAADVLRRRVFIRTSRENWLLLVALRDEDPNLAQAGLSALLDAYAAEYRTLHRRGIEESLSGMERQVEDARLRLEQSRAAESTFRRDQRILSTDPDANFIAQRVTNLTNDRSIAQQRLAGIDSGAAQVRKALAVEDAARRRDALLGLEIIARDAQVALRRSARYDLEAQKVLLLQKYGEKHPRIIEITAQLDAIGSQLDHAVGLAADAVVAEQEQLTQQLDRIETLLETEEAALSRYRDDLSTLHRLEAETALHEDLHQRLAKNFEEQRVQARLEPKSLVIADPPSLVGEPVNRKRMLMLMLLLFGGSACGLGLPLLIEFTSGAVGGRDHLAAISGLAVIAEIPRDPGLDRGEHAGDFETPPSVVEAVRTLRDRLVLQSGRSLVGRCIAIVSPSSGDGRTVLATRLAAALARAGAPTLFIDADLRRPSLHPSSGGEPVPGLSDILAGTGGLAPMASQIPLLDVLPAGTKRDAPSELMHSPTLPEFLGSCRRHYRYIILDTPAADDFPEAIPLSVIADDVVLVARDQKTGSVSLRRLCERLTLLGPKLRGAVLNAIDRPVT